METASMTGGMIPVPITDERPWAVFAACRDATAEWFFPQDKASEEAALSVCARCPVRSECLDYALEAREAFGVWGGTTERRRRALRRRLS